MANNSANYAQLQRMLSYGNRINNKDMVDFTISLDQTERLHKYYKGMKKLQKGGKDA